MIGRSLGPYEVTAKLGEGGMGEVFRARDVRLQRDVAIKILPEIFASDPDRLARFEREAQTLAALNHPNIAQIHGLVEPDAGGYRGLVMECVDGETLAQRIARGSIPREDAVQIARQIADALEAAHERGIVHRDLKPANVKVTPDGTVKVLDFGLAKAFGGEAGGAREGPALANSPTFTSPAVTELGMILGTAAYMAPEQARGKVVDRRADIWAFGCVLYEMLAGVKPFAGETVTDLLSAIVSRDPDWNRLPASTPPALRTLVRRCLEKDPRRRLRDIGEARVALEQPWQPLDTTSAPASRLRAFAIAAGVMALMSGAGYWVGRGTATPAVPSSTPLSYKRLTFDATIVARARFAPDGATVIYSAGDGALDPSRVLMTRLDSIGSTRLSLPPAELLAISPSAELALMTDASGGRISLSQAGTLSRAPLFGGAPRPVRGSVAFADWSPVTGQLAIVVTGARERLESPPGRVLYETDGQIGVPRFSRDGRLIAFADWPVKNDDRGTLAVVDLDGAKRTISKAWEGLRGLAWSPDGREIWYSASYQAGGYNLYATALAGGTERPLAQSPVGLVIEDVRPDGKTLARQIDFVHRVRFLAAGASAEVDLSWLSVSLPRDISPDGRHVLLVYSGQGGGENYMVFVRGVDGSDAVQIGEGQGQQFSPDGRSVLSVIHGPPSRLVILPIGTGDTRTVPTGQVEVSDARWLADSRRIVTIGREPGHARRAYIGDLSGSMRPFSPGNVEFEPYGLAVAGDGRVVLRDADGVVKVFSIDGRSTAVPALAAGEIPIAWADADRALLIRSATDIAVVDRIDLDSGKRSPWLTQRPADPSLLRRRPPMAFSRDGRS